MRKATFATTGVMFALIGLFSASASAEVSSEEAKQLGGEHLTVFGAEKAGNKEGTIPEYTGQQVEIRGRDPKLPGYYSDPFADDKPLFVITPQNAGQYANLIDEHMQMFKQYPTYRMEVYPSRRTTTYPKYVVDNTLKNATSCKATDNELALSGCYAGIPFPIPKTGNQVMWNHLVNYEGVAQDIVNSSYIIPTSGAPVLVSSLTGSLLYPIFDPKRSGQLKGSDIYFAVRVAYNAPARKNGESLLILDAIDTVHVGRRAWQYIPGQRRVKLAPDLAYDTPNPQSGGASTMDDAQLFLGAMDRFNFKLVGKKEKIIPYNTFKTSDFKNCPTEKLLTKNHANPSCLRYELHRVWVVDSTLKPQFRHIYSRRKYYIDEDGYTAGSVSAYDSGGKLWRVSENFPFPMPVGGQMGSGWFQYDLLTGLWTAQSPMSARGDGIWEVPPKSPEFISPETLAGEGVR